MIKLYDVIMHPDRQAIIRRSKHFKRVLRAKGYPERISSLRAEQYRALQWDEWVNNNL